jgi:DJ-1/PfpI family
MEGRHADELRGLRVAILVDNGFEEVELLRPRRALDEAGAQTLVVSPQEPGIRGRNFREWGTEIPVDVPLDRAQPDAYDALLLPGGVMNPDRLRTQPRAVEFVKSTFLIFNSYFLILPCATSPLPSLFFLPEDAQFSRRIGFHPRVVVEDHRRAVIG